MARPATRLLLLAVLAAAVLAPRATTQAAPAPKHFLWALGASPVDPDRGENLEWRGGAAGEGAIGVERTPAVYVVFWGRRWAHGFRIPDGERTYSSAALQRYVRAFLGAVGGSAWAGIQTQYCAQTRPGSTSCAGGSGFVTNPPHQLKGVWTDPRPVPANVLALGLAPHVANDPIAAEARRAAAHFGHDPQATYLLLAPPGARPPRGPVWCGYHSQADAGDGTRVQYAFVPWLNQDWPGLGRKGCGAHTVDRASDAFGHGVFDGYSIVLGHEYAEAVVDPDNFDNVQDGWNDGTSTENGDKCAWHGLRAVRFGGRRFAVQPLWSNEAYDATGNGCVFSR
ncbi:MAG TPA: hypothetical protein VFJ91_02430 [Gaiellaceae bacterium]|nr:hypothetical protein [Gaiellaceae bacterium]